MGWEEHVDCFLSEQYMCRPDELHLERMWTKLKLEFEWGVLESKTTLTPYFSH